MQTKRPNNDLSSQPQDEQILEVLVAAFRELTKTLGRKNLRLILDKLNLGSLNIETILKADTASGRKRLKLEAEKPILQWLLFETDLFRALSDLSKTDRRALTNLIGNELFVPGLLACSRTALALPSEALPEGVYRVFHGSYMIADSFVVRRMTIYRSITGYAYVKDEVHDERTVNQGDISAPGIFIYKHSLPQVLTLRRDNAEGVKIFFAEAEPKCENGIIVEMFGTTFGMSRNRKPFDRVTLIERCNDWNDFETGIRKFEDWDPSTQAKFRNLAERNRSDRPRDPIETLT